jgi:hypothetical protein
MRWKMLEPEEGDYSAGIALVRSEIDYLKNLASPKRFVLQVFGIAYGSGDPYAAAENYYPTYFIDAGCTLAKNGSGTKVLRWNVANRTCRDYYVRMIEAYAAEFDGEPYFEGIVIPDQETSFDVDSSPAWSIASHDAGIRDLASRTKALFVESNVIVSLNYLARGTSHVEVASMMSYLTSIGVGTNPPDTCPYDVAGCESFWIDQVRIGVIGGEDYRGTAPIWQSVESSEMGWDTVGPPGGFTAQQVYDYAIYEQQASHMFWDRNEEAGNSQQRWGTGILPVINANPLTNTPCPALYEACNRN